VRGRLAIALVLAACGGSDGAPGGGDGGGGGNDGSNPGPADASPIDCTDVVCHYVRSGAAAGGDGSGWNGAWTELPDELERGHVYYVAAGDYPGYRFDDAASGDEVITVVRATAGDHGDGDGWEEAFDGPAVFGPIEIVRPGYRLDGRGRGIRVRGAFEGTTLVVSAGPQELRSLDIDGAFAADGDGQHVEGACTALDVSGAADVTIADCDIHDAADDGASLYELSRLRFEGNVVHALHACGTDGGCGPCFNGHSDGLEMFDVTESAVRGNLVYDVRSTATVFFGNWGTPEQYNEDLTIENNLFYAPEVGLVVYIHYARNIRFFHNVVWGVQQGAYGGLSIGPDVTDLEMYNNVILSVNYSHQGATFDPEEHRGDHNLFGVDLDQWQSRAGDVIAANPGFTGIPGIDGAPVDDPTATLFALGATSKAADKGVAAVDGLTLPSTDFFGAARDAEPDIGAIER
jgi:hypothetical protein